MIIKNPRIAFVLILLFAISITAGRAQLSYKISAVNAVNMKLSGTSTLHKWDMNAKSFTGDAQFGFTPTNTGKLTNIKSLSFSLPVLNLKSNDRGLDKNAYKALKADVFKNITYKLTTANVQFITGNKYLVKTTGNLSIAGVTNEIAMDVYCMVNNDATITCTGSEHLKMTDYEVKPPTFMLGAMKTGNDITLDFTMVYKN